MPRMHITKELNVVLWRVEMGSRSYCSAQCASQETAVPP